MKTVLIAPLLLFTAVPALAQAAPATVGNNDAATPAGVFTLGTPIKDLIASPQAKAVLDKDLPGLSSDENLGKFEDKSLRELQPLTGGQLTDALLAKTGADLAAIGSGGAAADTNTGDSGASADDDATRPDAMTTGGSGR